MQRRIIFYVFLCTLQKKTYICTGKLEKVCKLYTKPNFQACFHENGKRYYQPVQGMERGSRQEANSITGCTSDWQDVGDGDPGDLMLHNIEVRGLQSHIRAVIVGQFNKYNHPENGFDDMYALLHEYLQHWHIPVCYDFPVGHAHLKNFPLLTGAKATLEVESDGVVLHY